MQNKENKNLYVITGGPGVGKTSLIGALANSGFKTIQEQARTIIKQQVDCDGSGLPWADKELYAKLMLDASISSYDEIQAKEHTAAVFFDRGILDTICYMEMHNIPITEDTKQRVIRRGYNDTVFILPWWKEIYVTDDARKQSWEEAEMTFHKMKDIYRRYGYTTVEIPKTDIRGRLQFVLQYIADITLLK